MPESRPVLLIGRVHMPVPIDRDGARRRIMQASRFRQDFGIATECGMGREPEDKIDYLLEVQHAVAAS